MATNAQFHAKAQGSQRCAQGAKPITTYQPSERLVSVTALEPQDRASPALNACSPYEAIALAAARLTKNSKDLAARLGIVREYLRLGLGQPASEVLSGCVEN